MDTVSDAADGMKEDKARWSTFFQWFLYRVLKRVKLVVGNKCFGMLEAVGEIFPEIKYQRSTVHFYLNIIFATPRSKVKLVNKMLKEIHAQENKKVAWEKTKTGVKGLRSMKVKEDAKEIEDGIEETLHTVSFQVNTRSVFESAMLLKDSIGRFSVDQSRAFLFRR